MPRGHGVVHGELTLTQLRAFERVVETGSFSVAATELCVAQSSISRTIHRLEQVLGAPVLERGSQGASLTPVGQAILGDVRHLLALADGLSQRSAQAALAGAVSLGGFRSATEQLLPQVLSDVRAEHPALSLSVHTIPEVDGGVGRAVQAGRVDIGIVSLPAPEGLIVVPLFADPYVRVEPVGGPADLPFILWNESCSARALAWLQREGDAPQSALTLDDDRAVLAHIAQGIGYSIMPALSVASAPARVRKVELPGGPVREVGACTTDAALRRANVRAVFEAVKSRLSSRAAPANP